jgi:hypothetical protein
MTLQTGYLWRAARGALASSGMAIGLLAGVASATAHADLLDDVGAKYMEGAGGGQISNYVKQALQLRAQGFKPSKTNMDDLQKGWDYLPNQSRLVDALKETIAFQHRLQEMQQNQVNPNQPPGYNPFAGGSQAPPGMSPVPGLGGPSIDVPLG